MVHPYACFLIAISKCFDEPNLARPEALAHCHIPNQSCPLSTCTPYPLASKAQRYAH